MNWCLATSSTRALNKCVMNIHTVVTICKFACIEVGFVRINRHQQNLSLTMVSQIK